MHLVGVSPGEFYDDGGLTLTLLLPSELVLPGEVWKNVKILKYPTRFANELRLGVRDNQGLDQIL